jgi:hypothetical protein
MKLDVDKIGGWAVGLERLAAEVRFAERSLLFGGPGEQVAEAIVYGSIQLLREQAAWLQKEFPHLWQTR